MPGGTGGREIDRAVDLETIPLHDRAGAILPFRPVRQYVDEPVHGPLSVTVYPGPDGTFGLYEDDGKTFDHRTGGWMGMAMAWTDAARRLTLRLAPGTRLLAPARRSIELSVAGQKATRTVVVEKKPLDVTL